MTDIQAALGCTQLKKLAGFVKRRCEIAKQYDEALVIVIDSSNKGTRAL